MKDTWLDAIGLVFWVIFATFIAVSLILIIIQPLTTPICSQSIVYDMDASPINNTYAVMVNVDGSGIQSIETNADTYYLLDVGETVNVCVRTGKWIPILTQLTYIEKLESVQ